MARNQQGFTIVELLISVAVFSVLALIVMVAIIQLGRSYQLGATKSKLMDASRQVHSEFIQSIEYGAQTSTSAGTATIGGSTYNVWCAGTTRFSWVKSPDGSGNIVSSGTALYKDTVSGVGECSSDTSFSSDAKELLPPSGFVTAFNISASGGIYTLYTRFAVGLRDMFVGNDINNSCQSSNLSGQDFCSVVEYNSTATKKVN